jgi:predicted dehydrogenase
MIQIGLIGTGVALRTHLPAFRRTGLAEVIGLVGSSRERGERFAAEHGIARVYENFQELCEDQSLDLVVVAGPNDRHYPEIEYALECGKHVLAEKPLAMTLGEVEELVRLAGKTDRLALINHQLRFSPYMQAIRASIRSGDLGRLYFIRFHFQGGSADPARPFSWHFDQAQGGGVRLAMGSHLCDLLRFWLGKTRVLNVHGRMDAVVPERRDPAGVFRPVHTAGFYTAHLSLEGNLEVQMSDTMAFGESEFTIVLYGTRGELVFDARRGLWSAHEGRGGLFPVPVDEQALKQTRAEGSIFRKSFDLFAQAIVAAIRTGDESHVVDAARFADAVPTQRVLEAVRESALTGEVVKLSSGYSAGARF